MPRPLRVFLCHASQDKPVVRKLHRYLKQRGVQPWLDELDLLPGEYWEVEIPNALFASDVILVCLSKNSVNKEGFVQKEITFALDKAQEKPEGTIFIIPVKLEACDVPKRLNRYQWVDLFHPDGYKRLMLGLDKRAIGLGSEVSRVLMPDETRSEPVFKPVMPKQADREIHEKGERRKRKQEAHEKGDAYIVSAASQMLEEGELKIEAPKGVGATLFAAMRAREENEREPKEKAEPEAAMRAAREKTQHEKMERDATEKTSLEKAKPSLKLNFRSILTGIILLFALVVLVVSVNILLHIQDQPTPTASSPKDTATPKLPASNSIPFTSTPQLTKTPVLVTTLGIGSIMIGEKGETLVYVPKGEFTMGDNVSSDSPVHTVYLDAFWIDQTEVTNKQYKACVDAGMCELPSSTSSSTHPSYYGNPEFDDFPVIHVNWDKANRYCEVWMGGDLPTEAQWEKAARGTDARIYPWGNDLPIMDLLNFANNIGDTTVVKNYPNTTSFYGTYDMAGNVWEWVNDRYGDTYYQSSTSLNNPLGPESGQYRVKRGGAWNYNYDFVRLSSRFKNYQSEADFSIGFRCARLP
jgi:formylglycine-generating enzyme required for sulfatase activity